MKVSTRTSLATIRLDYSEKKPLYRQLYESIRAAILDRRLEKNFKLPSSRELAREFGISRNTVTAAFEQLMAEGYLEGHVGAGTFVTQKLPDELLAVKIAGTVPAAGKRKTASRLSARGKLIASTPVSLSSGGQSLRPFTPCVPSVSEFPFHVWAKLTARRLRLPVRNWLNYGDPAGFRPLREAISAHLGAARGVRCRPDQVLIVSGTQQAVDLTARLLLDPGDAVWVENPGYLGSRGAVLAAQARIVPVPVDEEGLSVAAGKKLAPHARLISVTPSHQYPLGVTMSLARRLELLEWAKSASAWILEDDYDSEFRYENRPLAALQGLDRHERVIYIGTFSKVLGPGLRVGYMVVPPDLVDAFTNGKALLDRQSPIFEQVVLADFFTEGHFARHVRRMRHLYAERRTTLIAALDGEFGESLAVNSSSAGLHLTCWLKDNADDLSAARAASLAGIDTEPISAMYVGKNPRPGLVLGYAPFNEREINSGVRKLAVVLTKQGSK